MQWGDEGKGKVVDAISGDYDLVSRFQGGPNAGHSLCFDNRSYVLHTIPSGIFHARTLNLIGNGVVLDPAIFRQEAGQIVEKVPDIKEKILVSRKTHLILPTHRALDAASEKAKGKTKIGSTLRGIGPAYMDKTGRNGLRVGDIEAPDFIERYNRLKGKHLSMLRNYPAMDIDEAYEKHWMEGIEFLKAFQFIDSEYYINNALHEGKTVLAEGAQGTLLDIEFGTYPYVTSSNTISAGACTGLGLSPGSIGNVKGIFKAYCTRVGSGPFTTELDEADGEKLRDEGREFGSTTGRPRRCGWLDLVALRYAVMLSGVNHLIMTKADVLNSFSTIKAAVAYETEGKQSEHFPYEITEKTRPVYKEFPGWQQSLDGISRFEDLPKELKDYISYIEQYAGAPVVILSTGPDREETVYR